MLPAVLSDALSAVDLTCVHMDILYLLHTLPMSALITGKIISLVQPTKYGEIHSIFRVDAGLLMPQMCV